MTNSTGSYNLNASQELLLVCSRAKPKLSEVENCFQLGADPNYLPIYDQFKPYHFSPLSALVLKNTDLTHTQDIIDCFVDNKVDLNLANGMNHTILYFILFSYPENLKTFFYLVEKGANIHIKPENSFFGRDIIEVAIERMLFSRVGEIIEALGMPIDKINHYISYLNHYVNSFSSTDYAPDIVRHTDLVIAGESMGVPQLYDQLYSLKERSVLQSSVAFEKNPLTNSSDNPQKLDKALKNGKI